VASSVAVSLPLAVSARCRLLAVSSWLVLPYRSYQVAVMFPPGVAVFTGWKHALNALAIAYPDRLPHGLN
jgi:hypothetical protein